TVIREVVTSISKAALDLTRPEKKGSGSTRKSKSTMQKLSAQEIQELIIQLEGAMHKAAENLDFETAIQLREQLLKLKADL
ncbi:MAG TPA: UvrB/UvrC motif-containing protein, partial [Candidatus Saccharimonadales bacterium]|nr:UvrB/UvrC motif-containing protein [Candidatus Saccharimonadales bacterium]